MMIAPAGNANAVVAVVAAASAAAEMLFTCVATVVPRLRIVPAVVPVVSFCVPTSQGPKCVDKPMMKPH